MENSENKKTSYTVTISLTSEQLSPIVTLNPNNNDPSTDWKFFKGDSLTFSLVNVQNCDLEYTAPSGTANQTPFNCNNVTNPLPLADKDELTFKLKKEQTSFSWDFTFHGKYKNALGIITSFVFDPECTVSSG